jgi:hypothetical protein
MCGVAGCDTSILSGVGVVVCAAVCALAAHCTRESVSRLGILVM